MGVALSCETSVWTNWGPVARPPRSFPMAPRWIWHVNGTMLRLVQPPEAWASEPHERTVGAAKVVIDQLMRAAIEFCDRSWPHSVTAKW